MPLRLPYGFLSRLFDKVSCICETSQPVNYLNQNQHALVSETSALMTASPHAGSNWESKRKALFTQPKERLWHSIVAPA
jgi:hypothetical protein